MNDRAPLAPCQKMHEQILHIMKTPTRPLTVRALCGGEGKFPASR